MFICNVILLEIKFKALVYNVVLLQVPLKYLRLQPVHIQKYIQGVHCDMIQSKCIFWAEKFISQAKNLSFVKIERLTFMKI